MKISKKSTIYRFIDQKEQILLEIVSDALFRGFSVPGKSLSVPRACLRCSRLFSTLAVSIEMLGQRAGFRQFFFACVDGGDKQTGKACAIEYF